MQEKDSTQQLRYLCPLQCADAAEAVLTAQSPADTLRACRASRASQAGQSVGLVRRRRDWFLWRSLECALQEAQFLVECTERPPFQLPEEGSGF